MADTIQMKCKSCNGVLSVDEDQEVLECPYCGAKELILDSDFVKAQRIKSRSEKEIEFEKMKNEEERAQRSEEKQQIQEYKKSKLCKFTIVFAIISAILMVTSFSDGEFFRGLIALIQTGFLVTSWLTGIHTIREKFKNQALVLTLAAVVLLILFIAMEGIHVNNEKDADYSWPTSGISSILPMPASNKGEIIADSDTEFYAYIYKIDKEKYNDYVEACKDAGFTINADKSDDSFYAFNSERYELELLYFENDEEMWIEIKAPEKYDSISWPNEGSASLLPVPDSLNGKISMDSSEGFAVSISDISTEAYKAYVDACREKGFNIDYENSDNGYKAGNNDGCELKISYDEAFDIMRIDLKVPERKTEISSEDPEDSEDSEEVKSAVNDNEISPEFKEAMDSYEAFFDEYIEFMEEFSGTDGASLTMLAEYTRYMQQYAETMEKLDAMEEREMTTAETAYFIEATSRINQKLLSVSLS